VKAGNLIRWSVANRQPNYKTGADLCLILDLNRYQRNSGKPGHWFSFRVLVGDKVVFLEEAYARRNYEVIS